MKPFSKKDVCLLAAFVVAFGQLNYLSSIEEFYDTLDAEGRAVVKDVHDDNGQRPHLIFHVGPGKTGTTSLQSFLRKRKDILRKGDSYVAMINGEGGDPYSKNCLLSYTRSEPCERYPPWKSFIKALEYHNSMGNNVIISDEGFGDIDFRKSDWTLYRSVLKRYFQVKVVVAYRRYSEWLPSFYNQWFKFDGPYHRELKKWPDHGGVEIPTIGEFFHELKEHSKCGKCEGRPIFDSDGKLIHPSLLLKKEFEEDLAVDVLNFHEGNFVSNFICQIVPAANKTCNSALSGQNGNTTNYKTIINPSAPLHYQILAVAAYKENMVRKSSNRQKIVKQIRRRQEIILRLSANDFPLACISPKQEEDIKNMSLRFEQEILPELHASARDEHIADFERALERKTFCSVDVEAVLSDKGWQKFFASL